MRQRIGDEGWRAEAYRWTLRERLLDDAKERLAFLPRVRDQALHDQEGPSGVRFRQITNRQARGKQIPS